MDVSKLFSGLNVSVDVSALTDGALGRVPSGRINLVGVLTIVDDVLFFFACHFEGDGQKPEGRKVEGERFEASVRWNLLESKQDQDVQELTRRRK